MYDESVHRGAVAPYALVYNLTSVAGWDLSTATAGAFRVLRCNGAVDTWTAVLTDKTATTLTLTHTYVAGDLPDVEILRITPIVATTSGQFFGETKRLSVCEIEEL